MYVKSTETSHGQSCSESLVSIMNSDIYFDSNNGSWGRRRGGTWTRVSGRGLEEIYLYPVLDERDEKVRKEGVIRGRAVLAAIGMRGDGRRCDREHVSRAAEPILMRRSQETAHPQLLILRIEAKTAAASIAILYLPFLHDKDLYENFCGKVCRLRPHKSADMVYREAVLSKETNPWLSRIPHNYHLAAATDLSKER